MKQNLWQSSLWEDFQKKVGRKVWRIEDSLLVRHSLPLGLCWLEVPRGPVLKGEKHWRKFQSKAREIAKKEGVLFVRMSPFDPLPDFKADAAAPRLRPAKGDHHPRTTLLLDLKISEEDLLKQMKSKGRYNIRVAKKHGITVEISDDLDAFYDLLKKTGGRDGFGIHPKSYYKAMLEAMPEQAKLFLAYEDKEDNATLPVAGGIFVYHHDRAIYYYGASDHSKRHLMAPYLIQWEAILEGKHRECKTYDFLGIAPDGDKKHPWSGVTDFKRKFGGYAESYPQAQEMVIRPFLYGLYRVYKAVR